MAVSLSVIVPSFGDSAGLGECLRALQDQDGDIEFEVIVVESSAGARVDEASKEFPFVRLIRSADRLFPGAARNLGVRHAGSERLAFLDADCVPSRNWIREAFASIEANHRITGGPILDARHGNSFQSADNQLQFSGFRAGRKKGCADHLPSCNLLMGRATFEALGGFDEGISTGEDVLLSDRAGVLYPRSMWFNPILTVSHRGRASLQSFVRHQESLGYHRGWLQLAFTPAWKWFSRSPWLAGFALSWRLVYIALQTWRYSRKDVLLFMFYSPILLLGLVAWTVGFYRGVSRRRAGGEA
jgi:glycosyltransferase involved in cell wall biosynthesis